MLGDVANDFQIIVGQAYRNRRDAAKPAAGSCDRLWRAEDGHACSVARNNQYSSAKVVASWCATVALGIAAAMCASTSMMGAATWLRTLSFSISKSGTDIFASRSAVPRGTLRASAASV